LVKKMILVSAMIALGLCLLDTRPVAAGYIDPNAGGMLFQLLAVAFALFSGLALVFSRQIRATFARLRRFFSERFHRQTDEEGTD
jgi:hypothetical protein